MVAERPLANAGAVAEYLDIPVSSLLDQRYRNCGVGALAIKVGRHLRWRWTDIDAWLDQQATQASASAPIESADLGRSA